ncbi:AAA family ATPase [Nocardia sp. NPDC050413]|uniref:AAA family ATPase n=1 Tax=Nocardia sp. NPDC050413 TaxID=3155784 RepID=UPI0033E6FDDE
MVLSSFATERDDVPVWAWSYGGKGRVPVGALALFAGRPGAGKSTAGRWFAAAASNGVLEGCWYGKPVNTAYIAAEESAKYVVKPGLRAAGADLRRVFMPKVQIIGEQVRFLSSHDMEELAAQLKQHEVKLVVVDPLMSTIGSKTDINRNNEVRSLIEPWSKLAEDIDGVVLGIAHLNKSGNGDVVAGINGSSAFGEVARSVFGFAKDPDSDDGDRILSQEKNSIGEEDLALTYRIESATVTTDTGKSADVGRFVIVGTSDRTVGDVLRDNGRTESDSRSANDEVDEWLRDLLANNPVQSTDVYKAAVGAGFSADKAKRAKARIKATSYKDGDLWFWKKAVG